ncbi:sigma-54 interaction domain-containing protein [Numidum massiliense]|uniref:sigma-54 interaction domain-containing protein n=1 Tax=Numidum massiliense TaxID=1522315 RepID=UPI000ADA47E1|nr:sigma 54-interacting transcriptional regulator [Numidum massiliense]
MAIHHLSLANDQLSAVDRLQLERLFRIYKNLLDEIDVGIHVIDNNGKTIIYNKKMMHIEAMEREDVLDKRVHDVFMFTEQQDSTLMQALKHGKVTSHTKQTYFNNRGKEITTVNNTHPIYEDGNIVGAIEIARDVTKIERLMRENRARGNTRYTFNSIIGHSAAIREVVDVAQRATRTNSSVLIVGETGTGKEMFAQSIHNYSNRASAPFVSQNCAALPEHLVEGILFGTKRGAFTGSTERQGLFEQAEGGSLLLDEINALNPNLQAKLLRVLQEKSVRRIGGTRDQLIDVRFLATINEDPIEAINHARLRKDLYYRLSVVTLFIPPLRERKEDIVDLVHHFIAKYNDLFQMDVARVSDDVLNLFYAYDWPGNVRELEHVIEGAMNLIVTEDTLTLSHLPPHFAHKSRMRLEPSSSPNPAHAVRQRPRGHLRELANVREKEPETLQERLARVETNYLRETLARCDFNVTRAAKELGISRQSLQYRLRKYNIN